MSLIHYWVKKEMTLALINTVNNSVFDFKF